MKSKVVSEPADSQPTFASEFQETQTTMGEPPMNSTVYQIPAPELVHQLFTEHHIRPVVVPLTDLNAWVGDGHVLNDKPLLKVTYVYDKS